MVSDFSSSRARSAAAFTYVNGLNIVIRQLVSGFGKLAAGGVVVFVLMTTASSDGLAQKPLIAVAPPILSGDIPTVTGHRVADLLRELVALHYQSVTDEQYRTAARSVFREIKIEQCTEGYCIYRIKQELAVTRLMTLELTKTGELMQLKITMVRDDDRLVEEEICQACSPVQLEQLLRETFAAIRRQDMADSPGPEFPEKPRTLSAHLYQNRRTHLAIAGVFLLSTWGLLDEAEQHNRLSERNRELETLYLNGTSTSGLAALRTEYESNKSRMDQYAYRMNLMQFIMVSMIAVEVGMLAELLLSGAEGPATAGRVFPEYAPLAVHPVIGRNFQTAGLALTWKW